MKPPKDRYIKVGKVNTHYWEEGTQGSPVILIHGIGCYIELWSPTFEALAAQHRVYALDLLGHGRTDKPQDVSYKLENLAQFVNNFMTALGIEHAHVVGHSLGGAIATKLCLLYPTLVDKLVLAAPGGLGKEGPIAFRIASLPILGELLTRPSRSSSARMAKIIVHDPKVMTEELIEENYQMTSFPGAQKSLLKIIRAIGNVFGCHKSVYIPNVQGLASITNPTLVIWGRQDRIVPVAHADVAAKRFPNVRVEIFENCGHFSMLEHSNAFNKSVLGFLRD